MHKGDDERFFLTENKYFYINEGKNMCTSPSQHKIYTYKKSKQIDGRSNPINVMKITFSC